jgi:hypothetical protein
MGRVRSATFERMVNRFGREICLELVEVCGYTLLLTTIVNVTQVQLADTSG